MKKHLIAAAVAAAVAVPAVAQVTVSGVLDVRGVANSKTTTQATNVAEILTAPKTSATGNMNGWSSSQIAFSGTEDLGGGLKASFFVATGLVENLVGNRDTFLALQGGFGTVRLGRFAPAAALGFHGYTQANLNSAGSLYQVGATDNNARYGAPTAVGVTNFERNNNTIQFTSPTINGFTANVNFRSDSSDASALAGKAAVTQQGLHLQYAAGPLTIGAATNDRKGEVEAVTGVAGVLGTTTAAQVAAVTPVAASTNKQDLDWVGAQYNFGVATVGFANIKRGGSTTTAAGATTTVDDLSINVVGATVPLGALTLRLTGYEGSNDRADGTADDLKLSGHQASVTYTLSKRTFAYAVLGEAKTSRAGTNVGAGARKESTTTLGLSHSF